MLKAKHKTLAALFGGLGLLSLVVAGLAARRAAPRQRGRVDASERSPRPDPYGARGSADTYSVAGEEDPGAAVDAPAPSPPPSHTT
jgi:hypothetical protein